MSKERTEQGYTVVDTVDITDRPIPNADPAGQGNMSFEQNSYFKTPDYNGDDVADE